MGLDFSDTVDYGLNGCNLFEDIFRFSFVEGKRYISHDKDITLISQNRDDSHLVLEVFKLFFITILFPITLICLAVREIQRSFWEGRLIEFKPKKEIPQIIEKVVEKIVKVEVPQEVRVEVPVEVEKAARFNPFEMSALGRGRFRLASLPAYIRATLESEIMSCDKPYPGTFGKYLNGNGYTAEDFNAYMYVACQQRIFASEIIPGIVLGGDSCVRGITMSQERAECLSDEVIQDDLSEEKARYKDNLKVDDPIYNVRFSGKKFRISYLPFTSVGEGIFDVVVSVNREHEKVVSKNFNRTTRQAFLKQGSPTAKGIHSLISAKELPDIEVFQRDLDEMIYLWNHHQSLYIHCRQGHDRSPIYVACLLYRMALIQRSDITKEEILAFIRKQRPFVNTYKEGAFAKPFIDHLNLVEKMPIDGV